MNRGVDAVLTFVRRYVMFVGGALGTVLLAAGVYVDPRTRGGTVLVAVGGAVVAAFVLALISLSRDDLLDALFRQGLSKCSPAASIAAKSTIGEVYWRQSHGSIASSV
ncbi:MAG TPA: hypothetical protein VMD79_01505 [Solirubrobacteraceae bacterium]|nr:hypothetical protein [Solirubrobacteraceae bacterium]